MEAGDQIQNTNCFNYTGLYYKLFGDRLRSLHGDLTSIRLSEELQVRPNVISNILNNKIYPSKNPYLISRNHLISFSEYFNMDVFEFAWGNTEERELLVAIILLGILFNGIDTDGEPTNPFYSYDETKPSLGFISWSLKQKVLPDLLRRYALTAETVLELVLSYNDSTTFSPSKMGDEKYEKPGITLKELHVKLIDFFENEYGFFFSNKNHDLFKLLVTKRDPQLENLSNILVKQLLNDFNFTKSFPSRMFNWIKHTTKKIDSSVFDPNNLFMSLNSCGDSLIDFKEYEYVYFIKAFNKFWKKNKDAYLQFFNSNLFEDQKLLESGFKYFQNEAFDNLIKSDEFDRLNRKLLIDEQLSSNEAILSALYFRTDIAMRFEMDKLENENEDYNEEFFNFSNRLLSEIENIYEKIKKT